jgi:RNA recognition motif-containing protein
MANRAYVGNLPFTFTSADLQQLFGEFGPVRGAEIVMDRETGRSRGFGFVEMETEEALKAAKQSLDGKPVGGRNLTVNEARERAPRAPGAPGGSRAPGGPRPGGDRAPYGGGSGAPRPSAAPRPGFGDRPAGSFGDRPASRGRVERTERTDRLEKPEKERGGRWRYKRGGDDDE